MPRRIDVELTSERADGTWTWRVAGARKPRGVLDGALLYTGVKVGDVVRAEADFDLDGISVLAILPPKETKKDDDRLELLAPARDEPLVRTNLVGGRREGRRDRGDARRDRGDGGRRPAEDRDRRPSSDRPTRDRPGGRHAGPGDRPGGDRSTRDRPRAKRAEPGTGGPPPDTSNGAETSRRRRERPRRPEGAERRPASRPKPPAGPPRPKPKRLRPGRTHRKAVLDALPPEQQPVAEQVLQGGIPAVRQAIEKQNAQVSAEGKPEIRAAPLLALAEDLLPRLRTAEWRDRAEAALADVDELDLRDLRSVVVAADAAARDDETRELASTLRQALSRRVDEEQKTWLHDVTVALDEGRVVRALRLSSRPPKAGTIFPREVATRLADAAGASLTAEANTERWSAVLDAIAFSPVRRAVVPQSLPAPPGDDLLAAVRKLASRVPEIAAAFGVEPPAEPSPRPRPRRRPPPAPKGTTGGRSRPAPPTSTAAAPETTVSDPAAEPAPSEPAAEVSEAEPAPEAEPAVEPVPEAEATVEPVSEAQSEPESTEPG